MASSVLNYFTRPAAAVTYAKGRPSVHAEVLARIWPFFQREHRWGYGVDMACGAGASTLALLAYCETVVGVDPSLAMLAEAPRVDGIQYRQGTAEHCDLPSECAEVITMASAYHWVDHLKCLAEAKRLLLPGGHLVVYNPGSTGTPREATAWREWFDRCFYRRFPVVPRYLNEVTLTEAEAAGLEFRLFDPFEHDQEHSLSGYTALLMSRSNVISAIESGLTSTEEAQRWIEDGLRPFFPKTGFLTLRHQGKLQILRRPRSHPASG